MAISGFERFIRHMELSLKTFHQSTLGLMLIYQEWWYYIASGSSFPGWAWGHGMGTTAGAVHFLLADRDC